ncbi:hypothetical protein ACWENQ_27690 [Nonomuraea sp. NPDC004354]
MSMELMVWRADGPVTRERAAAFYRAVRGAAPATAQTAAESTGSAGPAESTGDAGPVAVTGHAESAEVAAFAKELPGHATALAGHALVTMAPEEVDDVSNAAFSLARQYGLVCYDPQRDLVHNLGPLGVDPETQLHTGDGMMVVNPDLGLVRDVLATLSPQNPFAVLVTFGRHFIQVSPGYELEYKEGTLRTTLVTRLEEVQRAFDEYARGERGFLDRFAWVAG